MDDFSFLKTKSDMILISDLKALVERERQTLTEILHYIREIADRRLYLARGHSSLFAFLMGEMGYSESAAQRRILAMRLIKEVPEVKKKIETGKISLSVASQMQSYFRQEVEKRQVENIPPMTQEEKLVLLGKLEGTSARECERKLAEISPKLCQPKEKEKPLTYDKTLIQFLADPELMKKIHRLKSLMSHQNPESRLDLLFGKVVDIALEKLDPERREARRGKRFIPAKAKPEEVPPTSAAKNRGRHIPKAIRDRIWLRDQGKCLYRDIKTGKICGSTHGIQLDHRHPFSLGGNHSLENLRLRCKNHNLFQAKELFGKFSG